MSPMSVVTPPTTARANIRITSAMPVMRAPNAYPAIMRAHSPLLLGRSGPPYSPWFGMLDTPHPYHTDRLASNV